MAQRYVFVPDQEVICNGYPGCVVRMYGEGMVEVRLKSGLVCVSASFPDCYPLIRAHFEHMHKIEGRA